MSLFDKYQSSNNNINEEQQQYVMTYQKTFINDAMIRNIIKSSN